MNFLNRHEGRPKTYGKFDSVLQLVVTFELGFHISDVRLQTTLMSFEEDDVARRQLKRSYRGKRKRNDRVIIDGSVASNHTSMVSLCIEDEGSSPSVQEEKSSINYRVHCHRFQSFKQLEETHLCLQPSCLNSQFDGERG